MNAHRFQGKVALVTGGNSGIGLAAAQGFAAEGARVAIFGRDPETLQQAKKSLGANAIAIQADVSRIADIERGSAQVKKEAGRIDALFVNAGMALFAPIESVDEDFFDRHFATNVKGAYFTIQKALPLMPKGSAIVVNGSVVANKGMPSTSVYAATKAAVSSLARTLSTELVPLGVRLNVVHPGPIETPIFGRMGLSAEATQAMGQQILAQVPLGRFGSPDDIAHAVLYLCSDDAAFVHGTTLTVDGGVAAP